MRDPRPSVAGADRPRGGPFAELVDQILCDSGALDALAFAYSELGIEARRGLVRAVIQDIPNPGHALGALLAVESDATLATDLSTLLRRRGHAESFATLKEEPGGGEVCLVQPRFGFMTERMRIRWHLNQIRHLEVESRIETNSVSTGGPTDIATAVDAVAPLLWRHIREGHELPEGADRFAAFFSVT